MQKLSINVTIKQIYIVYYDYDILNKHYKNYYVPILGYYTINKSNTYNFQIFFFV